MTINSTRANTDGIINKLVTVFAFDPAFMTDLNTVTKPRAPISQARRRALPHVLSL